MILLRKRGHSLRLITLIGVLAAGLGACATSRPTGVFPLLSDGWVPGDPIHKVILTGTFEADLTSTGACAWLGPSKRYLVLWPAGYGVRFNPTELIGPGGQVLAKGGQYVGFEGGSLLPGVVGPGGTIHADATAYLGFQGGPLPQVVPEPTRCGSSGDEALLLERPSYTR